MNKQIVLCVESNKQSRTDYVYIQCTLEHFYERTLKIKQTPIFMGSKSKYNNAKIQREVSSAIRSFPGPTQVIYFIDTDKISALPEDKKLLRDIKAYCKRMNYDLVLFNKDVEDVYWGEPIPDNKKVEKSIEFRIKNKIKDVDPLSLSATNITRHKSNILLILDKYWKRKQ